MWKGVTVIFMHFLCETSAAGSNEIALWLKLLTTDDSETWRAVRLMPAPGLYRTNELKVINSPVKCASYLLTFSKETKNKGNQCSCTVNKWRNQAVSCKSDKVLLLELYTTIFLLFDLLCYRVWHWGSYPCWCQIRATLIVPKQKENPTIKQSLSSCSLE